MQAAGIDLHPSRLHNLDIQKYPTRLNRVIFYRMSKP